MKLLRLLDLFSGIGGFSLGLERTGAFETVAFCEIDPFCRRVLAKHWPEVPIYEDVRTLTVDTLRRDGIEVDAICGGFPCQDISFAGKGAGLAGKRSGLWFEYARIIGEVRPRYVIVENVGALLSRGLDAVLGTLASLGYDAEWHCIPASYVGAPHRRDRLWIVAYPASERPSETRELCERQKKRPSCGGSVLAYAESSKARREEPGNGIEKASFRRPDISSSFRGCFGGLGRDDWNSEPDVCRVADGISANVDRVAALGNAVVPQIPELIGRVILAAERDP